MTCEFLILNGANINCVDRRNYTPLHLSIEMGNTALSYLLLKHKAKYDIQTVDGKLPIDFAVQTAVNFMLDIFFFLFPYLTKKNIPFTVNRMQTL